MCAEVIELMKKGLIKHQVAKELDISVPTFNSYLDKYKNFLDAYNKGKDYAYAYWVTAVQSGAIGTNQDMSAPLTGMLMQNCFGWRKKSDMTADVTSGGTETALREAMENMTPEELKAFKAHKLKETAMIEAAKKGKE
jgi:orotate phosphoribosyltransferase-like protein